MRIVKPRVVVKQEARNLWQQVCSTQTFAADLALIAEAHALLAGPEQTGSKNNAASLPTAKQNGFAASSEADSHREVRMVTRETIMHHPHRLTVLMPRANIERAADGQLRRRLPMDGPRVQQASSGGPARTDPSTRVPPSVLHSCQRSCRWDCVQQACIDLLVLFRPCNCWQRCLIA